MDGIVSPKRKYSFWITDEQYDGLKIVKERDGVLESEQIRRAIDAWLMHKGIAKKSARPRVSSARKR